MANSKVQEGTLASFFNFKEKGTTYKIELLAGLTTFVTMIYVLFLQPMAMVGGSESFIDINGVEISKSAILIMTALISGISTIVMGLYTKLPFALSTGMGINFLLGGMLQSGQISYGGMMAIIFTSGLIFILLSILGIRSYIVELIPKNIKFAISASIGFFLAYLGFSNSGLADFSSGIAMGDWSSPAVLLSLIGFLLIIALEINKVRGGILIAVLITTLIGIPMGVTYIPTSFAVPAASDVKNIVFNFNFGEIFTPAMITIIFTAFFGDFFSTLGTVLGLGGRLNLLDEEGNLPGIQKPFLVDSISTSVGALFGCTTITTYVESASGVEAGGKTGFTSLVVGIMFLLSILLAPFVLIIPGAATAPALIYIGFIMVSEIKRVDFSSLEESFAPFIVLAFTLFFANFAAGIAGGVISHVFVKIVTRKFKDIGIGLYILAIFMIFYFII